MAPTKIGVCIASCEGAVFHMQSVSEYFDVMGDIVSCLKIGEEDVAHLEVIEIGLTVAEFDAARMTTSALLIYELPSKFMNTLPSTSRQLNLCTCLKDVDSISIISYDNDSLRKILCVHWNTFRSSDGMSFAPENSYLDVLSELTEFARREPDNLRRDRTGTGTYSVFARQARFDIQHGIPLLTTKKLVWKKVLEELLWFARGETDVKDLQDRGVHIWDGNSSRAFLDSRGLSHLPEGDIGPAYGFQWRHFGGRYNGAKAGDHGKYSGEGVDQLVMIEKELKENPYSRRIFMSAWNAKDVGLMALPPCHVSVQFYVAPPGKDKGVPRLSCHMYQRSVDTFLGFPWNIASYSMLTHILAKRCGMEPDELIISTGDTHIYADHVLAAETQLHRDPGPMPAFWISPEVAHKDWSEMTSDDFGICGYYPHPFISARMSV